jgi:hypothetical protein
LTAFAQNATPLQGIWAFSLPDAPDGYQKGTLEFKQVDDKLTATAKMANGTFTIREIKKDGQKYTCSLYVDGGNASITFEPKTNLITGIVKVDGWEMPITLTPTKE